MRIASIINGISLMVLIDSGASHNFIAPSVVSALNLWVGESKNLGVRIRMAIKCGLKASMGHFHCN